MYLPHPAETARVLRDAADYIDRNGYYLPSYRVHQDPESEIDVRDYFSLHTKAASHAGAIIIAAYGWPNPNPVKDGGKAYGLFIAANNYLCQAYDPDGDGYDQWVWAHEVSAALRLAAEDCEYDALHWNGRL